MLRVINDFLINPCERARKNPFEFSRYNQEYLVNLCLFSFQMTVIHRDIYVIYLKAAPHAKQWEGRTSV